LVRLRHLVTLPVFLQAGEQYIVCLPESSLLHQSHLDMRRV